MGNIQLQLQQTMNIGRNYKFGVIIGLFIFLRKCVKISLLLSEASKKQKILRNLPTMNVSQVIDYLKKHPTIKSIECFVQGVIRSDKPLTSIYNKTQKLVCDVVLGSYIHSNNQQQIINPFQFKDKFILTKPSIAPALKLYDISDSSVYGNIKLASNASITSAFSEIGAEKIQIQLKWFSKLWAIIAAFLRKGLLFVGRLIKGSRIQLVKQEIGIKQNQFVNVAARCSYLDGNQNPLNLYITNVVKQSYMFHQKIIKLIRGYRLSLLLHSVLTLVYIAMFSQIIKSVVNSIRDYIRSKISNSPQRQQEGNQSQEDSESGKFNCFICLCSTRTIIFKPCKHYGVCRQCYDSLETMSCPVCKTDIDGVVEVKKYKK